MATHKLMDGDLQVFKRTGRKHWQCAASIVLIPREGAHPFRDEVAPLFRDMVAH